MDAQPPPRQTRLETLSNWCSRHPRSVLALVALAALAPFLAKPFNIDDPMFIWAARQILAHPLNPYGFDVNWYGSVEPMWRVMESPPLNCYFMALAGAVFGWSEIALHAAFLAPALAVILGTHRLAERFCGQPLLAALVTLFTPVFLVSATTVMCDVLLLAFWIWAVVFWVEGVAAENQPRLAAAGALMALAVLTKFNGFCLVPLLAAHGLAVHRRPGRWLVYLLLPVLAGLAYETATQSLYGHGLFSSAAGYSATINAASGFSVGAAGLLTLTFTGGCVATAALFAPLLWHWRWNLVFLGGTLLLTLIFGNTLLGKYVLLTGKIRTAAEGQIVFWAVGGMIVLALAATDIWRRRDASAILLLLWVAGTLVFAGFLNWSVTGRSLLPLTPAVAILLVRRLDENRAAPRRVAAFLAVGAVFSLWVARADYLLAQSARQSAETTSARCARPDHALWFEGHWGYQHYMEKRGAFAVDLENPAMKAGDFLALPYNNTGVTLPKLDVKSPAVAFVEILNVPKGGFLTTMDVESGAGFYASVIGPLPFALGAVPPEKIVVFRGLNPTR